MDSLWPFQVESSFIYILSVLFWSLCFFGLELLDLILFALFDFHFLMGFRCYCLHQRNSFDLCVLSVWTKTVQL